MLRVGLTGGIGSGKSTVARRLAELGAVVVDADELARDVVRPGTPGLAAVVARFGRSVLGADGALDRPALGRVVFADPAARADLEAITHPLVAAAAAERFAAAPPVAVVVHDVPLLVEKAMGSAYHLVVVVGASERTRVARLVRDRGMSAVDAAARIASQASDAERRAAADVWLDNDGDLGALLAQVDALWHGRIAGFEANLHTGAASRRADVPTLVPPNPTWPAQAARLAGRIRHALGDTALDVQHIGSTAVPGLLAKDVLDLQIGVASLADADRPGFVRAMARQGFPRAVGNTGDTSLDDGEPGRWAKRFHHSADPGRVAHVHVREVTSGGWAFALLFCDWLRADGAARHTYAQEKQRLANACATTDAYAEAKEPWFASVLPRAERWAEQTGWRIR